jgi:hypothetical protein
MTSFITIKTLRYLNNLISGEASAILDFTTFTAVSRNYIRIIDLETAFCSMQSKRQST